MGVRTVPQQVTPPKVEGTAYIELHGENLKMFEETFEISPDKAFSYLVKKAVEGCMERCSVEVCALKGNCNDDGIKGKEYGGYGEDPNYIPPYIARRIGFSAVCDNAKPECVGAVESIIKRVEEIRDLLQYDKLDKRIEAAQNQHMQPFKNEAKPIMDRAREAFNQEKRKADDIIAKGTQGLDEVREQVITGLRQEFFGK